MVALPALPNTTQGTPCSCGACLREAATVSQQMTWTLQLLSVMLCRCSVCSHAVCPLNNATTMASKSSSPVGWLFWSHWLKATCFFSFLVTSRLGVLGLLLHWKNYSYGKEVLRYEPFAAHHHTCWISSLPVPNLRHHSSQPRTICTAFLASC